MTSVVRYSTLQGKIEEYGVSLDAFQFFFRNKNPESKGARRIDTQQ